MIVRNAIRCNICGDEIESKYWHDYVACKCGARKGSFSLLKCLVIRYEWAMFCCALLTLIMKLQLFHGEVNPPQIVELSNNLIKLFAVSTIWGGY